MQFAAPEIFQQVMGSWIGPMMASFSRKGYNRCGDPPKDLPVISTRGHFRRVLFGRPRLSSKYTETDYECKGDFQTVSRKDSEDITIFIHGWTADSDQALCVFNRVRHSFSTSGYEQPVIGYTWDGDWDWVASKTIAEKNATKLASFIVEHNKEYPEVKVRLVGHSLGSRLLLETLNLLYEWGEKDAVASASLLGGAVSSSAVAKTGRYGEAIEHVTKRTDNFWASNDEILKIGYRTVEWGTAIGNGGCEGDVPENYYDHDISPIEDHFKYYKEPEVEEIIATFQSS